MRWVKDRLGVAPIVGGVHEGFGTRNALLGLGYPYLEVLSLDPEQRDVSIPWNERVRAMTSPALLTVAIGRTPLESPIPMSRLRADGVVLEWAVEFTTTPLFFIDWMQTPRPDGLPDGGRVSSLTITTPAPDQLADVEGVSVQAGAWDVEAIINGIPLA